MIVPERGESNALGVQLLVRDSRWWSVSDSWLQFYPLSHVFRWSNPWNQLIAIEVHLVLTLGGGTAIDGTGNAEQTKLTPEFVRSGDG